MRVEAEVMVIISLLFLLAVLCATAREKEEREERKSAVRLTYILTYCKSLGCEDFGHTTIYNNAVLSILSLIR